MMVPKHRLAEVAALIADPSRAAMLSALQDGRALPATDLARVAGVSAATASAHLSKLRVSGLLRVQSLGRHRYFRLASADVADALEALSRLIPPRQTTPMPPEKRALCAARLCYDHLAGQLGVLVTGALIQRDALELDRDELRLGPRAAAVLAGLDVDMRELQNGDRALLRTCIDWTERREHCAGAVGAAIAQAGFEHRWWQRSGETRALRVTDRGRKALTSVLGLRWVPRDETH